MSNMELRDYTRLLNAVDSNFAKSASQLLNNDFYVNLSPEGKLGFIEGFTAAVSLWQTIPTQHLLMTYVAVLGVAGTQLYSEEAKS